MITQLDTALPARHGGEVQEPSGPLSILASVALIDRGTACSSEVRSDPFPGAVAGLHDAGSQLSPYLAGPPSYLPHDVGNRGGSSRDRPWLAPKVIVRLAGRGTNRRRLVAAPDPDGLVPTREFHVLWPIAAAWPAETLADVPNYLAAVLNSPFAAACFAGGWNGQVALPNRAAQPLAGLPIPSAPERTIRRISHHVLAYQDLVRWGHLREAAGVRAAIDEVVFRLYGLPHLEQQAIRRAASRHGAPPITDRQRAAFASLARPLPVDPSERWAALIGNAAVATGATLREASDRARDLFPDLETRSFLIPTAG